MVMVWLDRGQAEVSGACAPPPPPAHHPKSCHLAPPLKLRPPNQPTLPPPPLWPLSNPPPLQCPLPPLGAFGSLLLGGGLLMKARRPPPPVIMALCGLFQAVGMPHIVWTTCGVSWRHTELGWMHHTYIVTVPC